MSNSNTNNTWATPFDAGFNISGVVSLAQSLPSHSWEYGTAATALLELFSPELSEFAPAPFHQLILDPHAAPALDAALSWITLAAAPNNLADGAGAVGDPAALGQAAFLIGWTKPEYALAAHDELEYILNAAPRSAEGTISQRTDKVEFWADFVYMCPPFLAYTAAQREDSVLAQEAFNQLAGYHDVLVTDTGAWKHIVGVGEKNADAGVWSTGNGWAAMGMARVLASFLHGAAAPQTPSALADIEQWIKNILDAAMKVPVDDGLLPNYFDGGDWFGETSGTALLVATAYRMAVLCPESFGEGYIQWAEDMRMVLARHISPDGIAAPAINPLDWHDRQPVMDGSAEGQSFVVMMYAAWRDCKWAKICQ
ncbi:hypothetical protein CYLTODRAFT_421760 [Cylindrobasidium torrendii FP15055 ss-10]|uniref:Six-hairpin glycosidase n=1 Tax=Cylindrobasidium torrendii FP15055 ss-10 TaxID=1314674 RepID=A0A0D7BDJ8_9AGAR|nr:hypothetical protein CYLTODRAFT_421760 [Cylindrobasidium torrendii FP15055 ss-10]